VDSFSSDRNPVEELAEEFVERYRRGDRPSLKEYTDKYPAWAEQIRALFPALVVMERVRPQAEDAESGSSGVLRAEQVLLKSLGDYRILREIGRGGMGIVYEAEQESLGRRVALKVLAASAVLDPRHLRRFHREAKAAARLHHTNIVPVFGVGEQDGLHYYVMQFIQGQGLDEVLVELRRLRKVKDDGGSMKDEGALAVADSSQSRRRVAADADVSAANVAASLLSGQFAVENVVARVLETPSHADRVRHDTHPSSDAGRSPLSGSSSSVLLSGHLEGGALSQSGRHYWQSVARIGVQVAEALVYAEAQGILHRDIKPSNLLLDTHGTVWVTDFGLAKATDSEDLTHTGDIVGTLRYMAPERFGGQSDIRSDIYGLGLTLYELLTLRSPFHESDRHKLMQQVTTEEPPRPGRLNPAVPRDLETIVLKAIAREPAHRYQTPNELADDLKRFLDDRPIRARPMSYAARTWRWCRRKPALATTLGVVVALVLGIAVVSPLVAARLKFERDRALTNLQRAEGAEQDAREKLWQSYLSEAQARRWSGQPGRRFKSLEALAAAARIRPSLELRNEAIACMALADLRPAKQWHGRKPRQEDWGVAFDADIERYASSDDRDGTISVRRIADDVEVLRLPGPDVEGSWAPWLQFSPDGRFLAAAYSGDQAGSKVWDLKRGEAVLRFPVPAGGNGAGRPEFSPDGRQVVVTLREGSIRFYDLASRAELNRLTVDPGMMLARFHPREEKVAVLRWGTSLVQVLDANTGKVVGELPHPSPVACLAWHPDGKLLATGCDDRLIYLWNTTTWQRHAILEGHQGSVRTCVFNHGGDLLASYGWDGMTRLWDPVTGKQLISIPGAVQRFSRDDRWLAYAYLGPEVGLCEVATGRECRTLYAYGQEGHTRSIAISPRGRLLAAGNDDGIRLWDLALNQQIAHLPVEPVRALFDAAGNSLITNGRVGIHRWPIVTASAGDDMRIGPPHALYKSPIRHETVVHLSRDGRSLAAVTSHEEALVIDLENPSDTVRLGSHRGISAVVLSPDGRWAVTCTQHGGGIKVWNARDGKLVKEIPAGHYSRASFSSVGQWLVTISLDQKRQTWQVGSWEEFPCQKRHGGGVFSHDGKLLALTERAGSMLVTQGLELVDAETGRELATLASPNQRQIGDMAFSPDGSQLAVVTDHPGVVRLWDLRAVRQELTALGLDWDLLPFPPTGSDPGAPRPLRVEVQLGELADGLKSQPHLAQRLNNEAWLLATAVDPKARNPARAVDLARQAVAYDPYSGECHNTLGVAHYRAGDWAAAVTAIEKSMELHGGVDSFNWFFLAMAHWQLGDPAEARKWYDQAVQWMEKNAPTNEELRRFRAEASALLGH